MPMQPQAFIESLQRRLAKTAIGPSTLRGKGTRGAAVAARNRLAAIDLMAFTSVNRNRFRLLLKELTQSLNASLPKPSKAWGRARKALNIFLRDVVYNADLQERYKLKNLRAWLELPLDRHVACGLIAEPEGSDLPRWIGVKHLRPEVSKEYQAVATAVARRLGVCRVDLDVFYWRKDSPT